MKQRLVRYSAVYPQIPRDSVASLKPLLTVACSPRMAGDYFILSLDSRSQIPPNPARASIAPPQQPRNQTGGRVARLTWSRALGDQIDSVTRKICAHPGACTLGDGATVRQVSGACDPDGGSPPSVSAPEIKTTRGGSLNGQRRDYGGQGVTCFFVAQFLPLLCRALLPAPSERLSRRPDRI